MAKIFPRLSILLLSLCLSACIVQTHVIPHFVPRTDHEHFLAHIAYLEQQGVQVVLLGDTIRYILPTDGFFHPDSAEFRRARAPVLRRIAMLARQCGDMPLRVIGHTDNIGSEKHKLKRSYDQAFAIASYLWENGVARERTTIRGYAGNDQIADDISVKGSEFNRRVEIIMD